MGIGDFKLMGAIGKVNLKTRNTHFSLYMMKKLVINS